MDNSDETTPPPITTTTKRGLNFKATELRLGLPGLDSPERDTNDDPSQQQHQQLLSIDLNNGFLSGPKRDFIPGKWGLPESSGVSRSGLEGGSAQVVNDKKDQPISPASNERTQVVGWPPIRSFRKNTMASHSPKAEDEAEVKLGTKCLYVKVSMDGAPYLRKVDLRTYGGYSELSFALESMFSCFTIGQYCGSHGGPNRDGLSESGLMDLLHGSEYVLTYKDKDGDWMLVGDIPWKMFTETCRRLRIMKSSEAIGLAPRAMEKQLQQ